MDGRVELVRWAIERLGAGDLETFAGGFHPDVVVRGDSQLAARSEYRGREGLLEWVRHAQRRRRAFRFRAINVEPAGRGVLVELAGIGDAATGATDGRLYLLMALREGLVDRVHPHHDRSAALREAGVSG